MSRTLPQATLLAAFNEVLYGKAIFSTPEAHPALLKAALELGKTYAKLAPSLETGTIPAIDADFGFLDILWRVQQPGTGGRLPDKDVIKAQLKNGVEALGRSLNGVSDPINTLKFLNNLLNAAANSVSLNESRLASSVGVLDRRGDIRSAQFIRELMKFGFEVAKVNPTVNPTSTTTAVQGFLDRLWRGDTQQVRQAQSGLNAFFAGMGTATERIKGLKFAGNLVDAAALLQSPNLQTQKHNPVFLDALVELGGAYAALSPNIRQSTDEALTPLHSVLVQLYPDGEVMKGSAANYLDSYLQQAGRSSEPIELSTLFLKSFRSDNRYADQWRNLNWISSFLSVTRPYDKSTLISNDDGFMPISSMERSLNTNEIKYLRDTFGSSIDYSQVTITRGNFASTGASKTLGNTIHLEDTWGRSAVFQEDGKSLTPEGLILVAHELTHVWQWQNGGFIYAPLSLGAQLSAFLRGEGRNGAYNWQDAYNKGLNWKDWNPEQQAQAMQDYNQAIQIVYLSKRDQLEEAKKTILTLTPYVLKVRQREGAPVFKL